MVTKLELYNMALGFLGPVRLTALDENRPDRRELDAVYNKTLSLMITRGIWRFALRTFRLEPDTDLDVLFGMQNAYSLPTDYVRFRKVAVDERQNVEDRTYRVEGFQLFSDYNPLYLTIVSNAADYGLDISKFTPLYAEAVAAELAYSSSLPVTKDKGTKGDLFAIKKNALVEAKRVEAIDERVKEKPTSSWVNSRYAGSTRDQRRSPSSTGIGNGE